MKYVRSVLAVLVGYFVKGLIAGIFLVFVGWHNLEEPSRQIVLTLTFWRLVASVAAGYVAAAIAGRAEIGHAAALAALGIVVALATMISGAGGKEPLWAQIVHVSILPPFVVLGGYLRKLQAEYGRES